LAKAYEVREFLIAQSFSPASLILMDSGNGAYILISIDLPNDKESAELVKRFIEYIDLLFSDVHVQVDRTMFNAARIIRLAGTTKLERLEENLEAVNVELTRDDLR